MSFPRVLAMPLGSTARFSAADILMVHVLRRLEGSGILEEHPNLAAYIAPPKRGPPTSVLSLRNWRCSPASHRPADKRLSNRPA
jgi:hypothetical protein